MSTIKIGGRVSFDKIEDLENLFENIDFPIELALPWRYQYLWLSMENRLKEVLNFFQKVEFEILSIHATQGKISEETFLTWGRKTLEFADALDVKYVTIHPNQINSNRIGFQEIARRYIRRLERDSSARFSIETFGGKKRLFQPIEIIEKGLPMTLDVAHIHDNSFIYQIIESYWRNIKVVHLSSKRKEEHHLPIDMFCVEVLKLLRSKGWSGNVILEYLPWHNYRVRNDIAVLREHFLYGKKLILEPVNDKFKTEPTKWGYSHDGI